jgi:hypothetical protein
VHLFNPRRHRWQTHFPANGVARIGKTLIGRATVAFLAMNDDERIELRVTLEEESAFHGEFPIARTSR